MKKKQKQIWIILLQMAMMVLLAACGKNSIDDVLVSDSIDSQEASEHQTILSKEEETVVEPVQNQTNKVSLYKTISYYSNDGELQKVIDCTYDESDLTLTCVGEESGEQYIFTYDMFGRIIDEKVFDSNKTVISWRAYDKVGEIDADIKYKDNGTIGEGFQYQYDDAGNKVKYIRYNSEGGFYEEEYDSKGNEISTISHHNDGSIAYSITYDYKYDSQGNVIEKFEIFDDGRIHRDVYEYDANGNNSKIISYDVHDDEEDITGWQEYEYDANGNKTKISDYYKYAGDEYPKHSHTCTWEYDSNGNMIRTAWYRSDGTINYEEEYDINGHLIKHCDYDDAGSFTTGFENRYNSNGEIIELLDYNNGAISSKIIQECEYDINGNVVIRKTNDDMVGKELGKVEYEYDAESNLLHSSAYDSKGNAVVIDFQAVPFKSDEEMLQQNKSGGQYSTLAIYNIPVDTSEYYDYLLCSGGGYFLVAKQVESVTDIVEYVGVLDDDYNWVVPLSDSTNINPKGKIENFWTTGYNDFENRCDCMANVTAYVNGGFFVIGQREQYNNLGEHWYEAVSDKTLLLNILEDKWIEIGGYFSSQSISFSDGYFVAKNSSRSDGRVVLINSGTGRHETSLYCSSRKYIGQYSEGMFFAYDGFYDINENKVIDLSEYAGLIINNPQFKNGECELIAENANKTRYKAVIDLNGNFISDFSQSED